jgi:hypothetical protein
MLSESQFLELWHEFVKDAKPRLEGYTRPESIDTPITEEAMGLDSLDKTLVLALCADAYQIDAEEEHNIPNVTLKEVYDWFQEKKTRDFETVEEALEATL